jgi:flagellar FliJ protein
MARFEFKMEALLKLRLMKQQQCERDLAQRVSQLIGHQKQKETIEGQISDYYLQIRSSHLQGDIEISGLIADRRYLNHLHALKLHQIMAISKSQRMVDQARKILAEAKKQTDIMEKLKEKMFIKFKKEMAKKEIIELDDLANSKTAWMMQQAG